jgi:hypothetical protein
MVTFYNEMMRSQITRTIGYAPVLAFPRFDIPFYLAVDTSAKGIGYVLYQRHPGNDGTSENTRVVRFGSKALNHWHKSYEPTKLELLGVATSIIDCSSYLRSHHFVVECVSLGICTHMI